MFGGTFMSVNPERAIEVFVKAFSFTRSYTYPFAPTQFGDAWVMRDDPPRADSRKEEWVAWRMPPAEMDGLVTRHGGPRFAICAIRATEDDPKPINDAYRELGYRLQFTEPFFVHSLAALPLVSPDVEVVRVLDSELANRLAKAARSRQILPAHLAEPNPPIRQYVAIDDGELVGWVRSIVVGDATWVSNLYVKADFRRRGIGAALMARMLADDKAHGSTGSVLLASHTGAKLYPQLGYEVIGELMLFGRRTLKKDVWR